MNMENMQDFNGLHVDKENELVRYNDELHKYWVKTTSQTCVSVTTLIKEFDNFDEVFWSSYKALEAIVGPEKFMTVKKQLLEYKIFTDKVLESLEVNKEEFLIAKENILKEWATKAAVACERAVCGGRRGGFR